MQVESDQAPAGAETLLAAPSQRAMVLRRLAGPLLSIGMLCLALWALHLLAREVNYHDVRKYVQGLSHLRLLLAVLFTLLGYAVMTLYDRFALSWIRRKLPWQRITLISFISYAFSNAVGMSLLVSGSIRYRFYVQNGLGAGEIARVVLFCTTSFWLGLLALTGTTLLWVPLPPELPFAALSQPLGAALMVLPLAWLLGSLVRRPLRIWRWRVQLPSTFTALKQILVGALDWGLAAAVLYVLMPDALNNGFGHFLAIFVIAQIVGLISHVPGGLGVFEAVMLAGFGATGNAELTAPILGALAAFRVIYYLLPLCTATVLVLQREARGLRRKSLLAPWFTGLLPSFFAGLTLVSGAVLLFSGATRALPLRMAILREVLPLSVLEVSHLLASVIGMLLLILARGLQRRLDAAYWLTLVLLLAGAVFSLLKGIDYEEATLLILLAMALAPAHGLFYRRASLFSTTFSIGWIVAIVATLACATWLVVFSYKHVEYSGDLWWQFSLNHGGAPRALRALVAAAVAGMLFAAASLIRPQQLRRKPPGDAELAQALPLIKQFTSAQAHLALMGDKALLFDAGAQGVRDVRHGRAQLGGHGRSGRHRRGRAARTGMDVSGTVRACRWLAGVLPGQPGQPRPVPGSGAEPAEDRRGGAGEAGRLQPRRQVEKGIAQHGQQAASRRAAPGNRADRRRCRICCRGSSRCRTRGCTTSMFARSGFHWVRSTRAI